MDLSLALRYGTVFSCYQLSLRKSVFVVFCYSTSWQLPLKLPRRVKTAAAVVLDCNDGPPIRDQPRFLPLYAAQSFRALRCSKKAFDCDLSDALAWCILWNHYGGVIH